MSITRRLLLTLSITLLTLLFVGGYGLWELQHSQQRFQYVQDKIFPSIKALRDARSAMAQGRILSFLHASSYEEERKAVYMKEIAASDAETDKVLAHYAKNLVADDTDRRLLAVDMATLAAYRKELATMLERSSINDTSGARNLLETSVAAKAGVLDAALSAHIAYNNNIASNLNADNASAFALAQGTLIGVVAAALM